MEKSFTLNFLEDTPSIDFDAEYTWQPANALEASDKTKTATMCKGGADDFKYEGVDILRGFGMEKSFTLNFLEDTPNIDFDVKYVWQPANPLNSLTMQTATFCGKKGVDDRNHEGVDILRGFGMEKSFTLNFLEDTPNIDFDVKYVWQPANPLNSLTVVHTATFCGKKKTDDHTNE